MALIATTRTGAVEGREKDGALLFAGIPYAAAPEGNLRFQPPAPPQAWSTTRDATSFGPQSYQAGGLLGGMMSQESAVYSEDCLSLNVMTPALDGGRRPVLFWIHGGGFVGGSGATPWYNGHAFVTRHDLVVVTINYRLGALGFLHLAEIGGESYGSSGLNGILDQVAALGWVHDNIEAFGGDPDNVTIFGESAGAMSVGTLLGLPAAGGLFHKAVVQSGSAHYVLPEDEAVRRTAMFCDLAGLSTIDDLLVAHPDALIEAQAKLGAALQAETRSTEITKGTSRLDLAFQPVIDGVHLPRSPLEAVLDGSANDVPLLIGTNEDEWNLFALMMQGELDEAKAIRRLDRVRPGEGDELFKVYAADRPDASPTDTYNAILSDLVFRIPALRLAEAHRQAAAPGIDTRMYFFTHASTAFDGKLGSCHALEIPFVFDTVGRAGVDFFLGHEPPAGLAPAMNDAWAAFARTGDPSTDALPDWPVYDADTRATMELGDECRLLTDPLPTERLWWDDRL